ncbi:MAG TPA: phosphotransferase [Patescibacteria group bacterium]|nr:phosphotransferase [Patescibacteria group bacterium]
MKTGPKITITVPQVQEFLAGRMPQPITGVARLGEGWWSQAFEFRSDGHDYVARFGAHPQDFAKDDLAAAFSAKNMPVPDVIERGKAFGEYYVISERIHGDMIDHLDADGMRRIVPAFLNMLDAMRQTDVSQSRGFGMWDGDGVAPYNSWSEALLANLQDVPDRRNHGWRAKLDAMPERAVVFEQLAEQLRHLVPTMPNEHHLVHTDLLNRNLLVRDNKITGVIDWGNALYGDFLYDLAHYCLWAPWFPAMVGIDWEAEAALFYKRRKITIPNFHERVYCYQLAIAADALIWCSRNEDWEIFDGVARRITAITP